MTCQAEITCCVNSQGSCRSYPDMIVMKSTAADRCWLICANKRVNAATAFETAVWPNAFRHHDTAFDLVVPAHVQDHDAQFIADPDLLAIRKSIDLHVGGMHEQFRPAFAFERPGCLIECGIQKRARRTGGQPERMGLIRRHDDIPMIRKCRHLVDRSHCADMALVPHSLPVGFKPELAVGMGKPVQEVSSFKTGLNIAPSGCLKIVDA